MKKRVALIAAGCIAAGSVLLSGCATEVKTTVPDVIQVQNLEEDRKISLSTSETVKVAPDMAGSSMGSPQRMRTQKNASRPMRKSSTGFWNI